MAGVLTSYLQRTIRHPFIWGECDCALWAAGAVMEITGFDPASALRGKYSTAREMFYVLSDAGGLLRLVSARMNGFATDERQNGIAVVQAERRELCGILIDGKLWAKFDGGAGTIPNPVILEGWNLCLKR